MVRGQYVGSGWAGGRAAGIQLAVGSDSCLQKIFEGQRDFWCVLELPDHVRPLLSLLSAAKGISVLSLALPLIALGLDR